MYVYCVYLTFDGRPMESKKSDPKKGALDVEYSTFDYTADRIEKIRSEEGCFGCRIFDYAADRIEKIRFFKNVKKCYFVLKIVK